MASAVLQILILLMTELSFIPGPSFQSEIYSLNDMEIPNIKVARGVT